MNTTVFGHAINEISEGIVGIRKGKKQPLPLKHTIFNIDVKNGLAVVKTSRNFSNNSRSSIEAIMTFPVPFDAVLTGLSAEIDGRRLRAISKGRDEARDIYEDAVDQGKMAILHEEPLRGIHMLSIGQLGSNKNVTIETEMVLALQDLSGLPFFRLPMTVGDIYGHSPLMPSDSFLVNSDVKLSGQIFVSSGSGKAKFVSGDIVNNGMSIPMNQSIELFFPDQVFGEISGFDAWGRKVSIRLNQNSGSDNNLDVSILLDRSGSTNESVGFKGKNIRTAIEDAVRNIKRQLPDNDLLSIWEFDDDARLIKTGYVSELRNSSLEFSEISGGTQIGSSIETVINARPSAIIVLTDGQSYANEVQSASKFGYPISAILVGPGSLDAMIGHLAASTGGHVYAAAGDDVLSPLAKALKNLRKGIVKTNGRILSGKPEYLNTSRSGTEIKISWDALPQSGQCDSVGRYAMALAMPLFNDEDAENYAELHGLVTHLTSLVLVDEEGVKSKTLPQSIKIPLPTIGVSHSMSLAMDMSYSSRAMRYSNSVDDLSTDTDINVKNKKIFKCSNSNCGAEFFADNGVENIIICKWCGAPLDNSEHDNEDLINSVLNIIEQSYVHIDWDNFSILYYENTSKWPILLNELIERISVSSQINDLIRYYELSIQDFVLLCLSQRDRNQQRSANRFYRNITSKIDPMKKIMLEQILN